MSSLGPQSADSALLRIRALEKRYSRREGWRTREIVALHDIDLEVQRRSTLAIVGDSGAGKTTLARCIAAMEKPDAGSITFAGSDLAWLSARELRRAKADLQLIFQDPSTALNPRLTAEELITEPLLIQRRGTQGSRAEVAARLMREVGLSPDWLSRRPSQFSGGQLQRIALARALAIGPRLLILDEAFTGLDLSTAAQIANLLLEQRAAHDLTYILISHDVALAARFADHIAVMAGGTIVECGPVRSICDSPQHGATRALLQTTEAMNTAFAAGEPA